MTRLLESAVKRSTEGTTFRALESYVSSVPDGDETFDGPVGTKLSTLPGWSLRANNAEYDFDLSGSGSIWPPADQFGSYYGSAVYDLNVGTDCWVELDVRFTVAELGVLWTFVRLPNDAATSSDTSYSYAVTLSYDGTTAGSRIRRSGTVVAGPVIPTGLSLNTVHTVRIEIQANKVVGKLNGTQFITYTDPSPLALGGLVGFEVDDTNASQRVTEILAFRTGPLTAVGDDFNRADTLPQGGGFGGIGLGAEWNSTAWYISSNQAARTTAGATDDFATFLHDLGTSDMWVEADVTPNVSYYGVLNVRRSAANDAYGYLGFWDPSGHFVIGKQTPGTYQDVTNPGGNADIGIGTTFKLRLEVEGTALRLYANNVLKVTGSDSTINSTDYPAYRYAGMNANNGPFIDNFRCGPLPYTP